MLVVSPINKEDLRMEFAKKCIGECLCCHEFDTENGECLLVKCAHPIDYAPIKHGRWIERIEIFSESEGEVEAIGCTECGKSQRKYRRTKYCPDCGAKMDLKENNPNE